MQLDFTGKNVLITGATRGIGKAIADLLYDLGASLILTGTKQNEIAQLNKQLTPDRAKRIQFFQADFSD
jgi:3-oxoacyl-[acyl-carrier protein] reductase